jgi:hypothetical protein
MRIVSLVPSATEMLFALGLGPDLIAVTHECDYPPAAQQLPKLIEYAGGEDVLGFVGENSEERSWQVGLELMAHILHPELVPEAPREALTVGI